MNEAETRAEHMDPALVATGWGVVDGSRIRREYPITLGRLEGAGKRGKPLTADHTSWNSAERPPAPPWRGFGAIFGGKFRANMAVRLM